MGIKKRTSPKHLALRPATPPLTYERANHLKAEVGTRIGELAQAFGGALDATPAVKAAAYSALYSLEKGLAKTMKLAKDHIKALAEKDAVIVSDKGSKELHLGGLVFPLKRQASGTDPKKFEAMLRARNADLSKYMDRVVSYIYSEDKVKQALSDGILTADELKTCEYMESYSLMPPKMEEEVE